MTTGIFGDDIGSTVLYGVDCLGNEAGVENCSLSYTGTCSLDHSVGVICQGIVLNAIYNYSVFVHCYYLATNCLFFRYRK